MVAHMPLVDQQTAVLEVEGECVLQDTRRCISVSVYGAVHTRTHTRTHREGVMMLRFSRCVV